MSDIVLAFSAAFANFSRKSSAAQLPIFSPAMSEATNRSDVLRARLDQSPANGEQVAQLPSCSGEHVRCRNSARLDRTRKQLGVEPICLATVLTKPDCRVLVVSTSTNVVRRLYHFGRSVSDLARACRLMGEGAYDRLHAVLSSVSAWRASKAPSTWSVASPDSRGGSRSTSSQVSPPSSRLARGRLVGADASILVSPGRPVRAVRHAARRARCEVLNIPGTSTSVAHVAPRLDLSSPIDRLRRNPPKATASRHSASARRGHAARRAGGAGAGVRRRIRHAPRVRRGRSAPSGGALYLAIQRVGF